MASLTIRNIPDSMLDQIRSLSTLDRRSMNSEILVLLEQAVRAHHTASVPGTSQRISTDTQIEIWRRLSGEWEDERSTDDIVNDIYDHRTDGRSVDL